jgi:hypothetical protein
MILTKGQKEKEVIELYFNEKKPYRYISQVLRMSLRDISAIIKKEEQKRAAGLPSAITVKTNDKQQPSIIEVAAYRLFSEGKDPVQVAIELNITEPQVTQFQRKYWNLKGLDQLDKVYEETDGNLEYFLNLYHAAKAKDMGISEVIDVLAIAGNDLPAIKERYEILIHQIQNRKQQFKIESDNWENHLESSREKLTIYDSCCEQRKRELDKFNQEKLRLQTDVSQFKSNNKEYLNKIKQAAEEKVNELMSDNNNGGKVLLLQLALISIIESLRNSPEKYYFLMRNMPTTTTTSSSSYQQQSQATQAYYSEHYKALIIEETNRIYDKLKKDLVNGAMAAAATISIGKSLPSSYNLQT